MHHQKEKKDKCQMRNTYPESNSGFIACDGRYKLHLGNLCIVSKCN